MADICGYELPTKLLNFTQKYLYITEVKIFQKVLGRGYFFLKHPVDGREIRWEESVRYLGVHITSAKAFACSLANAKKSSPLMQCLEKLLALLLKK